MIAAKDDYFTWLGWRISQVTVVDKLNIAPGKSLLGLNLNCFLALNH